MGNLMELGEKKKHLQLGNLALLPPQKKKKILYLFQTVGVCF